MYPLAVTYPFIVKYLLIRSLLFAVLIGKKRIAVCGEAHFLSMLFQKRGDLQWVYGCIRSEIKGDPAVFALDLRHIQTIGCHTDQGDPKQIIHCLGNIAKTV